MTGEALYERYKDALKRGHVASMRGRVDEALLAYAEAASIAPERPTPHASAGTALLRRKRPGDALRHYEVALSIAPRDETALLGRAQALAALDRRGEAADAFDALADVQAGSGRLADAVDAARRGLELAEGRERRRTLERLIARLRESEPDEPARLALERALQVLDGPAVTRPREVQPVPAAIAAETDGAAVATGEASSEGALESEGLATAAADAETAGPQAGPADGPVASGGMDGEASADAEPSPEAGADADAGMAEGIAGGASAALVDRALPPDLTGEEFAARAEAAVDAGEADSALEALLDLAAAEARHGRIDAALDACYAALSFDPDHVGLHLALVELYGMRGWDSLAAEKLVLLERLARLDADDDALAAVTGARAARA